MSNYPDDYMRYTNDPRHPDFEDLQSDDPSDCEVLQTEDDGGDGCKDLLDD